MISLKNSDGHLHRRHTQYKVHIHTCIFILKKNKKNIHLTRSTDKYLITKNNKPWVESTRMLQVCLQLFVPGLSV